MNPVTAIITLGISFVFLNIVMRLHVIKKIDKNITLIDKHIIKYIMIAVSVVVIDFIVGMLIGNILIRLVVVFGAFMIVYSLGLIITKDSILLLNWNVCIKVIRKIKNKLFYKKG